MTSQTSSTRLTGLDAIEYAERHGLALSKYSDPTEDEREGLTVDEAREVAREDASLIYIDASVDGELVLCRSDEGDGGWSLYAPGSTDEDIAHGYVSHLLSGPSEWDEDAGDWMRPSEADYALALRVLLRDA